MPRKNNPNSLQLVYEQVCATPGITSYEISKKLGMSGGNVRYCLSKLKKIGFVRLKTIYSSSRLKKQVFPVGVNKLLPSQLKKELKKLL